MTTLLESVAAILGVLVGFIAIGNTCGALAAMKRLRKNPKAGGYSMIHFAGPIFAILSRCLSPVVPLWLLLTLVLLDLSVWMWPLVLVRWLFTKTKPQS